MRSATNAARPVIVNSNITTSGAQARMAVRVVPAAAAVQRYQLTVKHNPATGQFVAVEKADTVSAGWLVLANESAPGLIRVVAYGPTPLALPAGAPMLTLLFQVTDAFDAATDLRLEKVQLNEDQLVAPAPILTRQK